MFEQLSGCDTQLRYCIPGPVGITLDVWCGSSTSHLLAQHTRKFISYDNLYLTCVLHQKRICWSIPHDLWWTRAMTSITKHEINIYLVLRFGQCRRSHQIPFWCEKCFRIQIILQNKNIPSHNLTIPHGVLVQPISSLLYWILESRGSLTYCSDPRILFIGSLDLPWALSRSHWLERVFLLKKQ